MYGPTGVVVGAGNTKLKLIFLIEKINLDFCMRALIIRSSVTRLSYVRSTGKKAVYFVPSTLHTYKKQCILYQVVTPHYLSYLFPPPHSNKNYSYKTYFIRVNGIPTYGFLGIRNFSQDSEFLGICLIMTARI